MLCAEFECCAKSFEFDDGWIWIPNADVSCFGDEWADFVAELAEVFTSEWCRISKFVDAEIVWWLKYLSENVVVLYQELVVVSSNGSRVIVVIRVGDLACSMDGFGTANGSIDDEEAFVADFPEIIQCVEEVAGSGVGDIAFDAVLEWFRYFHDPLVWLRYFMTWSCTKVAGKASPLYQRFIVNMPTPNSSAISRSWFSLLISMSLAIFSANDVSFGSDIVPPVVKVLA